MSPHVMLLSVPAAFSLTKYAVRPLDRFGTCSVSPPTCSRGCRPGGVAPDGCARADTAARLPVYTNVGVDTGVLALNDPADVGRAHLVDSPLVVGWRALTVALLDRIVDRDFPFFGACYGVGTVISEIIDVLEDPENAARDGIFATPTILRLSPKPSVSAAASDFAYCS